MNHVPDICVSKLEVIFCAFLAENDFVNLLFLFIRGRGKSFVRSRSLTVLALACLLSIVFPYIAAASLPNNLYRVDILPKNDFTRIILRLENPGQYSLSGLPGNRLRLSLADTAGPLFRKFRRYSDHNIGGLVFSRRGGSLLVTFQAASGRGWRDISLSGVSAITLDVGKRFSPPPPHPSRAGREKIWDGVEKLVRDFDPPIKSEFPFL